MVSDAVCHAVIHLECTAAVEVPLLHGDFHLRLDTAERPRHFLLSVELVEYVCKL